MGETGAGKSYLALKIAETFDPGFNVDRVTFDSKEFVRLVKTLPKGSFLVFDEPGLGLSHRQWYSTWNRVTGQLVQSSRFLQVNFLFTLPQQHFMDVDARRVAHFMAIMHHRGYAVAYRIQPNYFTKSPEMYTPKLGIIKSALPTEVLTKAYEKKRAEFHDRFFKQYLEEPAEQPGEPDLVKIVKSKPQDYVDAEGKISAKKIVAKHGCSYTTAYKVKTMVEGVSSTTQ